MLASGRLEETCSSIPANTSFIWAVNRDVSNGEPNARKRPSAPLTKAT